MTQREILDPICEAQFNMVQTLLPSGVSELDVWGALAEDALGHMIIEARIFDHDQMVEATMRVLRNTMLRLEKVREVQGKANAEED